MQHRESLLDGREVLLELVAGIVLPRATHPRDQFLEESIGLTKYRHLRRSTLFPPLMTSKCSDLSRSMPDVKAFNALRSSNQLGGRQAEA